jgi:MYXO-CTERM domain-containing protein
MRAMLGFTSRVSPAIAALVCLCALTTVTARSDAFCGFYVSGADGKLFNNATMVVMMREGQRTVLSMQNNYQGPAADFAMVVPVPVVLQEENVKTLPLAVFDRVDKLAAPRLVEYWEQDPCAKPNRSKGDRMARPRMAAPAAESEAKKEKGVVVEAEFSVGEYDIVILSASDSSGLDEWLKGEGYNIPEGAEPLLRPYVEAGSKFFVAKVDQKKVKKVDGQIMLSPLRFHYDTEDFRLPVRLGLMNSNGTQDLIVHILARGQRYEVANYENATIPTNIDVGDGAKEKFGEFYAALFDATMKKNKGAVVTEYSWDAGSCDPCPVPGLRPNELATLGLDVLDGGPAADEEAANPCKPGDPLCSDPAPAKKIRRRTRGGMGFVLTRLHARYDKASLGEDLVFKKAEPILGGREIRKEDKLEHGATKGRVNNFQGRYAIRHKWDGLVECNEPRRGVWGGPPKGKKKGKISSALKLAFAKRGDVQLASMIKSDIPELDLQPVKPARKPKSRAEPESPTAPSADSDGACGCRVVGPSRETGPWSFVLAGAAVALARRRRR